ncbi:PRELI domain-containing protein 2-like [Liolophura sinensis]|uniref:PRELI domain-containing protein 2-like n=1 Tax=Liolophura sinensis TaxID=3198878 RepID=UPI0031585321
MVITVNINHVYKYPVELVIQAHFSKYPSEKEKFVKKIEVLESAFNKGISFHRRLAICDNVIPSLLRKIQILDEKHILLEECSWIDVKKRMFTTKSHNVTWSKYASLWEKSVFTPCADNPKWTQLEQHGVVDISGLGKLGRVIELFAEKFLKSGVKRGITTMEEILQERCPQASSSVNCEDSNTPVPETG